MGFQQGLSGLNTSSKNLDVIGNNIANANTVGFKGSRAEFADIYAASFASSKNLTGIGGRVAGISQQFGQGNITTTDNPLDVAITGNGFFRMVDSAGTVTYTRNGQFQVDRNGYIINGTDRLTGWAVDENTGLLVKGGTPEPLQLTVGNVGARATGGSGTSNAGLAMILNLNASSPALSRAASPAGVGPLSITDPTTYTSSTSATIYDSLGVSHTLTFYFTKTAANTWEVQTSLDGSSTTINQGNLVFSSNGQVDETASTADSITYSEVLTNGATSPLAFNINLSDSTQYGSAFGVNSISQDGYADGVLTGISIGDDGVILGTYSNGQSRTVGQVVLANFANPQGLQPLGNNRWGVSYASGEARVGDPMTSDLGTLQSAAVEDANVDLTAELVNLITAQRNYQANAQTIKAQDTIMQTLVNLR